jgi:hypothetical protein
VLVNRRRPKPAGADRHPLSPAPLDGFEYMVAAGYPTVHGALDRLRGLLAERRAVAKAPTLRGVPSERRDEARRDADALAVVIAAAEVVLRMSAPPKARRARKSSP